MKKVGFVLLLALAACSGYSPLYDMQARGEAAVIIGQVAMQNVERNVGERRAAQWVAQRLRRSFPAQQGEYRVDVELKEKIVTLAVRRDATVERFRLDLTAYMKIYDQNEGDQEIFYTTLASSSAYNVESTPYSTDVGKVFARQSAAKSLSDEITRQVWLVLRDHRNKTETADQ
jgi:hypothetical protein